LRQPSCAQSRDGIRLLGKGEIKAKIEIEVAGASASAKEASRKPASVIVTFKKKVISTKR